jgi:hypothetical protein
MKMIDKMVEKALDSSPRLLEILSTIGTKMEQIMDRVDKDAEVAYDLITKVSARISDLTTAVVNVTQTLQLHQKAITDLYSMQNAINNALNDRRPSVELPDGKKTKNEKPN